jgi:hypothetical protein
MSRVFCEMWEQSQRTHRTTGGDMSLSEIGHQRSQLNKLTPTCVSTHDDKVLKFVEKRL